MAQQNQVNRNQQPSQQTDTTPGKRDFGKNMESEKRDSTQHQDNINQSSQRSGSQSQTGRDTDSLDQ